MRRSEGAPSGSFSRLDKAGFPATVPGMDTAFSEDAPVGSECRRVFLKEAAGAKACLDAFAKAPDLAIHEIRRHNKRMRGVLLLARPVLGTDALSQANRLVRDAARRFSAARDAYVLRESCANLLVRHDGPTAPDLGRLDGLLAERHARILGEGGLRDQVAEAARDFAEAARLVDEWDWRQVTLEIAFSAAVSNYRVALRHHDEARESRDPHEFHEWRKRVKYLSFHCRWLVFLDPAELPARAAAAEELASLLGEHHDLAVLEETFSGGGDIGISEDAAQLLIRLSEERRAELEEKALERAGSVHRDRPDELHERFANRAAVPA